MNKETTYYIVEMQLAGTETWMRSNNCPDAYTTREAAGDAIAALGSKLGKYRITPVQPINDFPEEYLEWRKTASLYTYDGETELSMFWKWLKNNDKVK